MIRWIFPLILLIPFSGAVGESMNSGKKSTNVMTVKVLDPIRHKCLCTSLHNSLLEFLPPLSANIRSVYEIPCVKNGGETASVNHLEIEPHHSHKADVETVVSNLVRIEMFSNGLTPDLSLVHAEHIFEGDELILIAILSETLPDDVIIPLNFVNETAQDSDYQRPKTIRIPSGSYIGRAIVQTHHDSDNLNETFTLSMGGPSMAVHSDQKPSLVTIIDDDKPEISLQVSSILEEATAVNFTVTVSISEPAKNELEIPLFYVGNTTESVNLKSIILPVGTRTVSEMIHTNIPRPSEHDVHHFTVFLNWRMLPPEVNIGRSWYKSITLSETTELPRVALSASPNPVLEGDPLTITTSVSEAFMHDLNIPIIFPPTRTAEINDFEQPSSPVTIVTIPAGESSSMVQIQTNPDADQEDEMFDIWLWTPALPDEVQESNKNAVTISIIDDNSTTTVNLSITPNPVTEGSDVTVYTTLSEARNTTTKIPLTLTSNTAEDTDYENSSPINLNIPIGQTQVPYIIKTFEDEDIDDETFLISIDSVNLPHNIIAGKTVSAEVMILDRDTTQISAPLSLEIEEGKSKTFSMSLTSQPSGLVTVTISGFENSDLVPDPDFIEFTPTDYKDSQVISLHSTEDDDLINDKVTLTLTASGGGYTTSHALSVEIIDNLKTDIQDDEMFLSVTLWGNYPNPAKNQTKIIFDLSKSAQISLTVTDILGRTIQTLFYGWLYTNQRHTVELNTENLTSGIYYYTLYVDSGDQMIQRSQAMLVIQ